MGPQLITSDGVRLESRISGHNNLVVAMRAKCTRDGYIYCDLTLGIIDIDKI